MSGESITENFPDVVELNVGGVHYTTTLNTLTRERESLIGEIFLGRNKGALMKDSKGKYFLDRDGVLFRYVLDFLRNGKIVLPENFHEKERLKAEADYFRLEKMARCIGASIINANMISAGHIDAANNSIPPEQCMSPGSITVSYRGTFAFGRDGLADVKFRKLSRILVSGRVALCREAFGDTLNESRDPDRGTSDRYTSRYFLKHVFLEQAFDMLQEKGFRLMTACASGTNSAGEIKPGMESEEKSKGRVKCAPAAPSLGDVLQTCVFIRAGKYISTPYQHWKDDRSNDNQLSRSPSPRRPSCQTIDTNCE